MGLLMFFAITTFLNGRAISPYNDINARIRDMRSDSYHTSFFDSLNMSFVGNLPVGIGRAVSVDTSRKLVFLGTGGIVYILNVENPENPYIVSDRSRTRGRVRDIAFDPLTNLLFIAAGPAGIEIWDVNNPEFPVFKSRYITTDKARFVRIMNQYLVVNDDNQTIRILDISNPTNPTPVGMYTAPDTILDIDISGDLILIGCKQAGLRIVNASNPYNPVEVGTYATTSDVKSVVSHYHYAYIRISGIGTEIIDIGNPASPEQLSVVDIEGIIRVFLNYPYLFLCFDYGFPKIVDVSDPYNPEIVGELPQGMISDMDFGDSLAFVVNWRGLTVFNIADPYSPVTVGMIHFNTPVYDVYKSGNYAYVVGSNFYIVDVSDPTNPVQVSSINTSLLISVVVQGDYAYAAGMTALSVFNIADPFNPYLVSEVNLPQYASNIYVSDTFAYIADLDGGLRIFDISDPYSPNEVGYIDTILANDVFVSGGYAYIAGQTHSDHEDMFFVVDISDPSSPIITGTLGIQGTPISVAVKDSFAYVGTNSGKVYAINVSDPEIPVETAILGISSNTISCLQIQGQLLFASDQALLRIIDISSPSSPEPVGIYSDDLNFWFFYVSGSYAYIPANGNMVVVDVSNYTSPMQVGRFRAADLSREVEIINNDLVVMANNNINLIDVTDPQFPRVVGHYPGYATNFSVYGNYLLVTGGDIDLSVLDISEPSRPIEVSRIEAVYPLYRAIFRYQNYVYIGDMFNLKVYDLSNPFLPQLVYTENRNVREMSGSGNILTLMSNGSIKLMDISNPEYPQLITELTGLNPWYVYMQDSMLYIADMLNGIMIFDISNPELPETLWVSGTDYYATSMTVSEGALYFTSGSWVKVLDVSDPSNPILTGYYELPLLGSDVDVINGGLVLVADVRCGLQIYKYHNVGIGEHEYTMPEILLVTPLIGKLKFNIFRSIPLKIALFDVSGRRVFHYKKFFKPGEYLIQPNLPSGVYFYRIKGLDFAKKGKFIILR